MCILIVKKLKKKNLITTCISISWNTIIFSTANQNMRFVMQKEENWACTRHHVPAVAELWAKTHWNNGFSDFNNR